jgi:predicted TIM-barrel fold metal-dependent hydrolase
MDDYCSPFPNRLTGVILCSARDVEGAVGEIRKWGGSHWGRAVFVYAPQDMPLDHPGFEPIWAAAAERDLAVVLHTFTSDPPYAPGGQDTWGNLWLQRSAAHPWCGMRNMAAVLGSGVMDRYPQLRVGLLEAGHGWLPFWVHRLDEHAEMVKNALPALKMKPSDYVKSGRYFQSIEMSEGPAMTKLVMDLLGEGILMYASDYPHGESWFPESTATVLGWSELNESVKAKLLWSNAARLYRL